MENSSPRLFLVSTAPTAPAGLHGLGHLRTFTFERVGADPSLPVVCGDRPLGAEKGQQLLNFSLPFSVAKPPASKSKQPWNQLHAAKQQQILLQGSPERSPCRPDSRYASGRATCGPLREISYRSWSASCATPAREAIRQEAGEYLDLVPCGTCHGLRLRPEALAVKVGPYGNQNDLTNVSLGRHP